MYAQYFIIKVCHGMHAFQLQLRDTDTLYILFKSFKSGADESGADRPPPTTSVCCSSTPAFPRRCRAADQHPPPPPTFPAAGAGGAQSMQ